MSLNRWKVLACTLTVGVGGLAVFATDPAPKPDAPKEPAPLPNLTVKPASPSNGADTPAPVVPVKGDEFELTVPVPPAPVAADEKAKKPADGPVFEPVGPADAPLIVPVKGEDAPKDPKKAEPTKTDDIPMIAIPAAPVKPEVKDPPAPPMIDAPKPPVTAVPKPDHPKAPPADLDIPPVVKPTADPVPPPPVKVETPAPPMPMATPPLPTLTPEVPMATPKAPETVRVPVPPLGSHKAGEATRLKMLLRMGDGQPRFEIRNSGTTELLMKVYGEKIEMQAPPDAKSTLAGVTAIGRVRFTAPGLEGTCDHLTILSGTGEVLLKGNIHLKTKHGKAWSEMTAEKMVYQIGTTGLTAPTAPRVTPASYIPD
jgi:hypothetical protein